MSTTMTDYDRDPRPDLASDHALWVALLTIARQQSGQDTPDTPDSLFGMLHCMRCFGAALEQDKDYGLIIRAGEWAQAEYDAFRAKHLAPRRKEVVALLKAAAPGAQEELLKAGVVAQVKAVEAKALAVGWTRGELEGLSSVLFEAAKTWGRVELGEVTAQHAELVVYQGVSNVSRLRHYRTPAGACMQGTATVKKGAM